MVRNAGAASAEFLIFGLVRIWLKPLMMNLLNWAEAQSYSWRCSFDVNSSYLQEQVNQNNQASQGLN